MADGVSCEIVTARRRLSWAAQPTIDWPHEKSVRWDHYPRSDPSQRKSLELPSGTRTSFVSRDDRGGAPIVILELDAGPRGELRFMECRRESLREASGSSGVVGPSADWGRVQRSSLWRDGTLVVACSRLAALIRRMWPESSELSGCFAFHHSLVPRRTVFAAGARILGSSAG